MSSPNTLRAHWYPIATAQLLADAELLNLVNERQLSRLPSDLHPLAVKKLDEWVGECCRAVQSGVSDSDVRCQLAKDTWNFLKPWKRERVSSINQTQDT